MSTGEFDPTTTGPYNEIFDVPSNKLYVSPELLKIVHNDAVDIAASICNYSIVAGEQFGNLAHETRTSGYSKHVPYKSQINMLSHISVRLSNQPTSGHDNTPIETIGIGYIEVDEYTKEEMFCEIASLQPDKLCVGAKDQRVNQVNDLISFFAWLSNIRRTIESYTTNQLD